MTSLFPPRIAFRNTALAFLMLALTGASAQVDVLPSSVDVQLVQGTNPAQLLVQVKTHSTANFGGILSALTVTIRYNAASGASLGNGTSFCNNWSPFTPTPVVTNAGTAYRTYNGFGANRLEDAVGSGGCNVSLVPEQWFTITTIAVTGSSCTAFTLGNDAWTAANNRNFYISMNGQNVTGAAVSGAVNAGNCVLDCLGVPGGTAMPGTACNDGNPNTSNDQWSASCVCVGTVTCTAPAITSTSNNSPICSGTSMSLGVIATGTAPLSYAWTGAGTFSPNNSSANVTVSGAATGAYQVTVTNACGNANASVNVFVNNAPSATIAYGGSPYCTGGGTASVTRTGSAGGTYTSTPTGLSINSSSGAITLGTSSVGTYTVTYSIFASGGCPAFSTTATVAVNNAPSATIAYSGSPYCTGSGTANVTRTGSAGGTYTATPAGLSISSSSGAITLGTSSVGTYTVTYSIAASGGCSAFSTTATVAVNNAPSATIAYSGSPYCTGSGTASVTRTGSAGGTYTATPAGLSISSSTGAITLGTSNVGTYTVTYSIAASGGCSAFSTTATVAVNNAPSATIAYSGSPYCTGSGTASVTRTGSAGGTYTATPAGLSINSSSGAITLGSSSVGTYTVTYSIAASGGCSAFSTTATVAVNNAPSATISYSGSPYCTGSGTASVTRTGSAGGTYTATPAGLSISSSTGAITLGTSSVGTYTVTYSIAASGGCSAFSTTATVAVNNAPSATIAYSGSPYCTGSGTANVTRTGSAGGTYTATPAGLSINSSTGAINLGTSSVGSYSVTYSIAASGGCSAFSTTATVALNNAPSATIAYSGSPYCTGSGTANVTRTGSAGGTYTATPAGLSISSSTGAITLGTSSVGTYTVTYSIAASGGCSAFSTTATVAVNNAPSATIAYSGSPYCTSGGTADVTRTGTGGGTYNGSPYGLSINTGTGAIDLGASQPGSYTMIYTIAASGGCSMFQTTTTLVISSAPSATINYAGSPYCTDGGFAAVTRTGSGGGTFSASPAGLSINAGTGSINLGTSAAGTYTVTYAFMAGGGCAAFNTTATVTLDQAPSATIGYEGTPYCNAGGTADVTRTGTAGGTYTSSAGGLSLNSATGAINLSASNVNTYTVFYTIPANGACAQFVATTSVTIANAPNATITYEGSPYCAGGGVESVTRVGTAGGTYAATPAGLTINANNGAITLSSSSVGTYTVTYSIAASGGCSAYSTMATVTVNNAPSATIAYGGSPYCNGGGTATVTRIGSNGGTYSAVPAGLSINVNNGAIFLGTSSPGSYTVTYSIAAVGGCSAFSTTAQVVVGDAPDATIEYAGSPYCGGTSASVLRTGSAGGTYTATPVGLSINANTGAVNITTSTPGSYTVTYSIAASGGCAAFSTTATVELNEETTWYADTDGDGVGVMAGSVVACTQPAGFVPISGDGCPNDPNKIAPGVCGCGIPDTDTDNDGAADCIDGCPTDPDKTAPGVCGCGIPDTDTDQDGLADCIDNCPLLDGVIGDACDDGDSTTVMDVITADCVCIGTFTIGISETVEGSGITLWPNPTADRAFTISMPHASAGGTVELTVRDASGRKVYANTSNISSSKQIAVQLPEATASGLYVVEVNIGEASTRLPVMCQ